MWRMRLLLCTAAVLVCHATTGEWTDCMYGATGLCIDTDQYTCGAAILSGHCSGGNSIRCCPSTSGFRSTSCTAVDLAAYGGYTGDNAALCKKTSECSSSSSTVTGKCAGPAGITCCVPTPARFPTPSPVTPTKYPTTHPTKYPTPSTSSSGSGTFLPAKPDASQSTGQCTTPFQKFNGENVPPGR